MSVACIVIEEKLELLRPVVSEKTFAAIAIIVAIVNLYLRLKVSTGLVIHEQKNTHSQEYKPKDFSDLEH